MTCLASLGRAAGQPAPALTLPLPHLPPARRDAVWGDDPEIQALCEVYNRPAEIWAFDPHVGARLLRMFNSARADAAADTRPPIRVSYYGGGHYDRCVLLVRLQRPCAPA